MILDNHGSLRIRIERLVHFLFTALLGSIRLLYIEVIITIEPLCKTSGVVEIRVRVVRIKIFLIIRWANCWC